MRFIYTCICILVALNTFLAAVLLGAPHSGALTIEHLVHPQSVTEPSLIADTKNTLPGIEMTKPVYSEIERKSTAIHEMTVFESFVHLIRNGFF